MNKVAIIMQSDDVNFDKVAWNFYASNYDDDGLDLPSISCVTQESDNKYDPAAGCKITFKPAAIFQNNPNSMQVVVDSQDLTEGLTKRGPSEQRRSR